MADPYIEKQRRVYEENRVKQAKQEYASLYIVLAVFGLFALVLIGTNIANHNDTYQQQQQFEKELQATRR